MVHPSPSGFQALEDDWHSVSRALAEAESGLHDALVELRREENEWTRANLKFAMEARQAAHQRMAALTSKVWDRTG